MDKLKLYNEIVEFLKDKGATKVAVFGSYVRNEETPDSDIDVIIDFEKSMGFLEFVGIEQDLSEKIGIKVDLLTEDGISPYLIDYVRREMKVIYQVWDTLNNEMPPLKSSIDKMISELTPKSPLGL